MRVAKIRDLLLVLGGKSDWVPVESCRTVALGVLALGTIGVGNGCSSGGDEFVAPGRRQQRLETVEWRELSSAVQPSRRMAQAVVYDASRHLSVVAGGRDPSDAGGSLQDTWLWDGQQFSSASSSFGRRGYVQAVFDSQRQLVVSFGGADLTISASYSQDTLEFDGASWARRTIPTAPSNRSSYGLAFDSQRGVTVLFAGYDGKWKNDIWEWDGTTWSRKCDFAPCSTSPMPSSRASPLCVYDAARGNTLIFGGRGSGSSTGDTWSWDGTSFVELHPAHSPSARVAPAATYDPVTRRILLLGGGSELGEKNDLWAWDGQDWQLIADGGPLEARRDAGMAWDIERRKAVVMGGRSSNRGVASWEFSLSGNDCSSNEGCHSGLCDHGVCVGVASLGTGGTGGAGGTGGTGIGGTGKASGGSSGSGGGSGSSIGGVTSGVWGVDPSSAMVGFPVGGSTADELRAEPSDPLTGGAASPATRQSLYSCAAAAAARVGSSHTRSEAIGWLALLCAGLFTPRRQRRPRRIP